MKTAVQFGAGNIGRGFIAQLFSESGLETVFVDVSEELIGALNNQHNYTIHIVGDDPEQVEVSNVRGILASDRQAVAEAVASSEIISTAVGAGALKHIVPAIAQGLALRHKQGGRSLNILICENLHDASSVLRELLAPHLPPEDRESILGKTGFVQAVVSRMVPLQERDPSDPLAIRVEAYKRLPVDGFAIRQPFPDIVGVEPVDDFEAYEDRKLYTHNCAHATLGYLGWLKGIEFGWQALDDPDIRADLDLVLKETGEALVRKYGARGFARETHSAHVSDLIARFQNRALGDTCYRLARDPVRKLSPGDRLSGAAELCLSQGVEMRGLPRVIAAAFRFRPPDDPAATEIHLAIMQTGFEAALEKYTGIHSDSPLGRQIVDEYERLAGRA
jgi:mannitol-1-phosphate 5-dehydrogenase